MSLFRDLRANISDVRALGQGVLWRHLSRWRGRDRHRWTIPGIGPVEIRNVTTDLAVFRQVFKAHEYDLSRCVQYPELLSAYRAQVAAGLTPVVIDAGANVGAASLWFAREFPQAHIIAIEPEPRNAACCQINFAGRPRIELRQAAIGAVAGKVVLENHCEDDWAFRTRRTDAADAIAIVTIPDLVATVPKGVLLLVKVDIEGFESDLFSSNIDWIDDVCAIVIEIHDWMMNNRQSSFALQKAMGERYFEVLIIGENLAYFNSRTAPVFRVTGEHR